MNLRGLMLLLEFLPSTLLKQKYAKFLIKTSRILIAC